ncbi:IL-6 subfamily cytokine M17 isoform X1 [Osmerus mordax]|uniref:IL-6 subfamily cytokine M17 isoform X1 n=1 Tax=Osmerus mordax TaxID=8014 RepID=UPI00350F576E
MYPQLEISQLATTLFSFLLVMVVDASRAGKSCRSQACGSSLQRSWRFTRLLHKESDDLLKIYKTSQGDLSELFCKMSMDNVPDPDISGLDPSARIQSMYSHIKTFLPHLQRVTEQQTDLQIFSNPLLSKLSDTYSRTSSLGSQISCIYQMLFPNSPLLEPAGEPTPLPLSQNIFQQKVYGCVVLKRLKQFLSNATREIKALKHQTCTKGPKPNIPS